MQIWSRRVLVLFLVLPVFFSVTFPCSTASTRNAPSVGNLMDEFAADLSSLSIEPINGAFLLVLPFDAFVRNHVPKAVLSNFVEEFDVTRFTLLALLLSAIVHPVDPYVSFTVLESYTVTLALTVLLKFVFGRARPYLENGPFHFRAFSFDSQYHSFPSGHASLSWSIFTPVAERFGVFWFSIPMLLSLQRITSDNHWLSDVVAGATLGWWIGSSFHRTSRLKGNP